MSMNRSGAIEQGKDGYWAYSDSGLSAVWIPTLKTKKTKKDIQKTKPSADKTCDQVLRENYSEIEKILMTDPYSECHRCSARHTPFKKETITALNKLVAPEGKQYIQVEESRPCGPPGGKTSEPDYFVKIIDGEMPKEGT
jgi:hypothetical protein